MMREWGKWLKRTTVIMMGAVLLGSTAGFSSQAGALPQTDGTGQGDSSRITVVSFSELSVEDSVRHVTPGCTEEEALRQLPSELEALVVIRTPQSAPVSVPVQDQTDASTDQSQDTDAQGVPADGTADTGNDGMADETPSADNATAPATTPSSGQKFLDMGENFVLEQVRMNVPVTWKLDVSSDYSTSGTFDSTDGTRYQYVPVLADADGNGNQFAAVSNLYQGQLPAMHVLVLNQDSGNDEAANEAAPTADSGTGGSGQQTQVLGTHGIWIGTEVVSDVEEKPDPGAFADANFVLNNHNRPGGSAYSIGGTWKKATVTVDGVDKEVISGPTPVITIVGPGTYNISLDKDLKLDTTKNGEHAKALIKVTGGAEVNITSEGGMMQCGVNTLWANAIEVERGSTVTIAGSDASSFIINGRVQNDGTLIITKPEKFEINDVVTNTGKMLVGQFKEDEPPSGVWYPGKLSIGGTNGSFVNVSNAELTIGQDSELIVEGVHSEGNGFINDGVLNVTEKGKINVEESFDNSGTLNVERDSTLTVGNSFVNDKLLTIKTAGTMEVGSLTNNGELTVEGFAIPDDGKPDKGSLKITSGADAVNSGLLQLGEGGTLESSSTVKVQNSGVLRIADVDCLSSNIMLEKIGVDPENPEAGGKFYLTGLTKDLLEPMPKEIFYTGDNQYSELKSKCNYKHEWQRQPTDDFVFEVTATEWSGDIYKDAQGKDSVGTILTEPGKYYIVWKGTNRRKSPVYIEFSMEPASLTIRRTGSETVSLDHSDLKKMVEDNLITEEELKEAFIYQIGDNMEFEAAIAIFSKNGQPSVGNSLLVTVGKIGATSDSDYLQNIGKQLMKEHPYTISFDARGCETKTIDQVPTVLGKAIEAGVYEIKVEYREDSSNPSHPPTPDEEKWLTQTKKICVVRSETEIDLSNYKFQYTYGDEIPNPVYGQTAIVKNHFGVGSTVDCNWYKTNSIEEVEANKVTSIGREFPTKEIVENNFKDWGGAIAGDYVLSVTVPGNDYSTGGVAYQKVNVARKDVALKIVNEPHKTYGTSDADTPIEYQAVGLVKWPGADGEEKEDVLEGTLSRERDKNNLVDGVQGPDNWDSVGAYHIEKGTLDEVRNPNYTINFDGNYNYTIDPKTLTWDLSNMIVAQQDNRYKVYGGLGVESGLETPDKGKVGVTYERLIVNEDGTILEVVEPKLININDAVDINYALNYNPPANNEISIRDSVYRLKVAEGSVEHLSSALKDQGKTTIGIEGEMSTAVKALRAEQLNYKGDDKFKIYDVMVTKDGNVVEDIFQKGGLIVTIPYPEGTSSTTHKFVATHMITSEVQGAKDPGNIERFAGSEDRTEANGQQLYKLAQTEDGIVIKVTGLSPVAIAWAPINSGNPNNPDDPNNPNNPDDPNNPNNPDDPNNPDNPDDPNNPNNPDNPNNSGNNNGTNGGNNGTNGGNNGTNGGTNNGTNSGTNNGTNSDNKATGTVNKTGTTGTTNNASNTTKTTSAKTGDTAQIAFYMIATLLACLLLILIICLIRAQFRKKDD